VKKQAQAESAALTGRIPWAQVALASNVPLGGLVYVDQQWLQPERLRLPYPVNPGWHTFLVESNGQVLAARRVHFEEGQSRRVPLSLSDVSAGPSAGAGGVAPTRAALPSDDDDDPWGIDSVTTNSPASLSVAPRSAASNAARANAARNAAGSEPAAASLESNTAPERTLTWHAPEQPGDKPADTLLTSAYVSLGIGAVGALVGTGFAIAAHNLKDNVETGSLCSYGSCDLEDYENANSQWRRHATMAGASYAVGLMGLVTGGILWLAHREYSPSPKTTLQIADLEIELEPGLRTDGAYLRGKF
jgi:hypothetical protein